MIQRRVLSPFVSKGLRSPSLTDPDPNNGVSQCQCFHSLPQHLREAPPIGYSQTGCKTSIFYIGVCQASENEGRRLINIKVVSRQCPCDIVPETREESSCLTTDEKILPVLRWLLIAFFGLLLVLAVQLFLLVTRADAATNTIRVGLSPTKRRTDTALEHSREQDRSAIRN